MHVTNMRESLAEQRWGGTVMGYMSEINASQTEGTANDKDGIGPGGEHRTTLLRGRRGWVQALQYQGRSLGCPPPQFPKMYSCLWKEKLSGRSSGSAMGSSGQPHQWLFSPPRGQDKRIFGKSVLGAGEAISGSRRKGTAVDLSVILFLDGTGKRLFLGRWWVVFL